MAWATDRGGEIKEEEEVCRKYHRQVERNQDQRRAMSAKKSRLASSYVDKEVSKEYFAKTEGSRVGSGSGSREKKEWLWAF